MRQLICVTPLLFVCLIALPALAQQDLPGLTGPAEEAPQTRGITPEPDSEATPDSAGGFTTFSLRVIRYQAELHRALSGGMAELDEENSWQALWVLLALCFLYGVFHAAGPGHGKAVLSTYVLTQPTSARKAITLSAVAALLQGVTAILLVLVIVFGLGLLAREAVDSVVPIERLSFTLIGALGIFLLLRAGRDLMRTMRSPDQTHDHCHDHHTVAPEKAARNSLLQNLGLVVSIGSRPCTGAVLVLVVANLLGLWWAGVLGVVAMSLGTALTVTTLALLAVGVRNVTTLMISPGPWLQYAGPSVRAIGGVLLLILGAGLLHGSLVSPVGFGVLPTG